MSDGGQMVFSFAIKVQPLGTEFDESDPEQT